jgi:hypothetical protein
MTAKHLAQINVGRLSAPLDDPVTAEFVALLDPINALADASPGFVWRFVTEGEGNATNARPFDDDLLIINFSVWETHTALWNYVYRSAHLDVLRRRREWFTRMTESFQAMWWVPAGHRPSVEEAIDALERIRRDGPTAATFTFRDFFDETGRRADHTAAPTGADRDLRPDTMPVSHGT